VCLNCYFVDVIGVVTGITIEREYIHDAKMTRMIILELTDHRFFFILKVNVLYNYFFFVS
jgi:hypothetical protein